MFLPSQSDKRISYLFGFVWLLTTCAVIWGIYYLRARGHEEAAFYVLQALLFFYLLLIGVYCLVMRRRERGREDV